MIKNDLFLRALKGETVDRPPVWMMRQAGRFLPEFMEIRKKYDFFTRCRTPELASEITVQPIRRFGMDAAILFSDILVIPQAMNIEVQMKPDFGPYLPNPVRDQKGVDNVIVPDVNVELDYVMQAIKATKEKLNDEVPLIGFAGSPCRSCCPTRSTPSTWSRGERGREGRALLAPSSTSRPSVRVGDAPPRVAKKTWM